MSMSMTLATAMAIVMTTDDPGVDKQVLIHVEGHGVDLLFSSAQLKSPQHDVVQFMIVPYSTVQHNIMLGQYSISYYGMMYAIVNSMTWYGTSHGVV